MQLHRQLKERIVAAESVDVAVGLLGEAFQQIGIAYFVAGFVRGAAQNPNGEWRRYQYRTFNLPSGWDENWHEYNAHCPYYRSCFDGRIAFDYESVRRRPDLSKQETKAWQYLADHGLIEGFVVPVHAPGHFGFVTALSGRNDRTWRSKIDDNLERLLYLSHLFHATVRECFPDFLAMPGELSLSQRELECLRWSAAGKTSEEIAIILGVAHETVRIYFKRALRKLNASTRAQAVAIAYGSGLLT